MAMIQLNDLLPLKQRETYWTFYGKEHEGLPNEAEYVVFESYCENGACDCQNLIAEIMRLDKNGNHEKKPSAIVYYDWSTKEKQCYPTLYEQSAKTPLAFHLLDVYKKFIHNDEYLLRIKTHYARVKKLGSEKEIKDISKKTGALITKVGRNDPCPCGSNKKYKKCCLLKDGK